MEWGNIILIGIAGVAGAIAGYIIAAVLGPVFSIAGYTARSVLQWIVVLGAIAAGAIYLPPYISPYAEPLIAEILPDEREQSETVRVAEKEAVPEEVIAAAIETALADLQDPFFEAVLRKEPSRAESVKSRLVSAYGRGGENELVTELLEADQEIIRLAFPYYMARAQEADLLVAVEQIRDTIKVLAEKDPETCHLWLYGAITGQSFDFDKYLTAVGEEGHLALQTKLATVVDNALGFPPEYDELGAETALAEVSDQLMQDLGVEKIGLITSGQMPESQEDEKLACSASAEYYSLILVRDNAADILRHRYLTNTG